MREDKKFLSLILLVLFVGVGLTEVKAISISPPRWELDYNPGSENKIYFNVEDIGEYGIEVIKEGNLVEYLTQETSIENCKNWNSCKIEFIFKIPEQEDAPGIKEVLIRFHDLPPPAEYGKAPISGTAEVVGKISYIAPYPNKYLIGKLNFDKVNGKYQIGEKIYFTVNLKSYGKETIQRITGELEIKDINKQTVQKVKLTPVENLVYGESKEMYGEWQTSSEAKVGNYQVTGELNYDNEKTSVKGSLQLGDVIVEVVDINPKQALSGQINKLTLVVKNYWNQESKVYVEAKLINESNIDENINNNNNEINNINILTSSSTNTINIPPESTSNLDLFLDLSKVVSGNYTLRLNSIFNDKQKESNFNIEVIDKIDSPMDANKESSSWFLVIGIMGLVIAILILVFIFVARRKEEEII